MIREEERREKTVIEENVMSHPNETSDHEGADEGDQGEAEKHDEISQMNCELCKNRQEEITKLQKRIHNLKRRRDELKAINAQQEAINDHLF